MINYFKKRSLKIVLILTLYLGFMSIFFVKVPYDLMSLGPINGIANIIQINGDDSFGSYYTSSILYSQECTIYQWLIAHLSPTVAIEKTQNSFLDPIENRYSGVYQKDSSINNAIITGFTAANKPLSYEYLGKQIIYVFKGHHESFVVGRIITHYNGEEVMPYEEYMMEKMSESLSLSQPFTVTFSNGETIELSNNEADLSTLYYANDTFKIDTDTAEPAFSIHAANSQGPSGGLLQSLMVYDAITSGDLTRGLKIGGTGTITFDGKVGPIGGMFQKVIAASRFGINVFFVPDDEENVAEAKRAYDYLGKPQGIELVIVKTIDEAVAYLEGRS